MRQKEESHFQPLPPLWVVTVGTVTTRREKDKPLGTGAPKSNFALEQFLWDSPNENQEWIPDLYKDCLLAQTEIENQTKDPRLAFA